MPDKPKKQIEKFRHAALEAEADESEEAFDAKLKAVAKPSSQKAKRDGGEDR